MAKPQSLFEIDTKGSCIFCLSSNCVPLDRSKADLTTSTALKMLFRYLNIDIRNVALASSTSSGALTLNASTNLAVTLCDACFFLVDEFLELFQEFERIRLQLERCTWKLHEFIKNGNKDGVRVQDYLNRVTVSERDELHARFVEKLRMETFKKGTGMRDSSFPKIGLRRLSGNCSEVINTMETETNISGENNMDTRPEGEVSKIPLTKETFIIKTVKKHNINTTGTHSTRKSPSITHRQNNRIGGNKIEAHPKKCVYCSKFFAAAALRPHKFLVHPVQMLSLTQRLPSCVSEQDVKLAIDTILNTSEKVVRNDADEKGSKFTPCPTCSVLISGNFTKVRLHILRCHQDQVCQSIQARRLQLVATSTRGPEEEMDIRDRDEEKVPQQITTLPPSRKQISKELTLKKYNVPCDICGKRFPSRFRLKIHKYRFHTTGSFKCELCNKTFLLDQTLQRHLRFFHPKSSVDNSNSSSWSCDFCDKVYAERKHLQQHIHFKHAMQSYASRIPSHISEQVFESTVAAIVSKILPRETLNRAFQKRPCIFCGKALSCSNKFLRIHIVRIHLEEVIASAQRAVLATEPASFILMKSEYPHSPIVQMQCDEYETGFKLEFEGDEEHLLATEDPLGI